MSTTPATYDAPIRGTSGNDFISVETSVSFQWVPGEGNAHYGVVSWLNYDIWDWQVIETIGPSSASGYVTFDGVASSEPFQVFPTDGSFSYTNGVSVGLQTGQFAYDDHSGWSYDPATGVLDPASTGFIWDNWVGAYFMADKVLYEASYYDGSSSDTDYGHWQLVPAIHNVNVFGGAGNDTILGGQGKEMLFGGEGNDLIRASVGDDLLFGGAGNDELHAGVGKQTLMGGAGNDTIWGGMGAQLLLGDEGRDVIHGGAGPQTLMGGVGSDTLWGGLGPQLLEGGNGNDVVHAGSGNETLSGGAGRDTFVFSTASGNDLITDFQSGHDIIDLHYDFGGLTLQDARDLLPYISADQHGNAVLRVGSDFSLVLQRVTLQQVEAGPADFFRVS
jgi:Ca2+-binding RTX toxin-like protein